MSDSSPQFDLLIHATHEAGVKVGGIGAVLDGLLSSGQYTRHVRHTLLVGPMDVGDREAMQRLVSPRNGLEIWYSSHHGVDRISPDLAARLRAIERQHQVSILYGERAFGDESHQVLLVDARSANAERINAYKAALFGHFGIQSDRYEADPEYRLHVHAAEAQYWALQAVSRERPGIIIAHEFMGLPLCYSAIMHAPDRYRTVFYGHETATVRPIIESHPGHDTMFYSVLNRARAEGQYIEDVFGDQSHFFKHALIRPVPAHCDGVFAVGDWVLREMRFLGPAWAGAEIDLVYNGVPSYQITLEQKRESHARLQRYCENLLGYVPDYVFTHVTRLIPSKGLWRDIRVMEELAPLLAQRGQSAVFFALSTTIPVGRPAKAVFEMEERYGWPVNHHETVVHVDGQSVPDLVSHEIPFYRAAEAFNRSTSAASIVLVNQYGWSRDRCGQRMPQDMTFADIRHGSDLEFGQSVYEPFGIAQVEPLCFGALCVVSNVCGCVGFLERVGALGGDNVVLADYTNVGAESASLAQLLAIDQGRRDRIEARQATEVARQIMERLPDGEEGAEQMIRQGHALSQAMSWDVVVRDYLVPSLRRILQR
jgi:hypothetical protein